MSKTFIAFGDPHIPNHNPVVEEILHRVIEYIRPDLTLGLGDMLDCTQFSRHPPTRGMTETDYEQDLAYANTMLDRMQASSGRVVLVEGNHENRIDRWAASTTEGRGAYSLLAPRIQLPKGRKSFTYIPYGSVDGTYPHYKINSRIAGVHGWSYAINCTKRHLQLSQGMSILHGHAHRADVAFSQKIWSPDQTIQARGVGCICLRVPLYGCGNPVEWVNSFVLGYLGKKDDSLYTVMINGNRCVLPDSTIITV